MGNLTRFDLDPVTPNNPVFIKIANTIWGIPNTGMLKILVKRYGENLPGILKNQQGLPTGRLFGTAPTVIDQELHTAGDEVLRADQARHMLGELMEA